MKTIELNSKEIKYLKKVIKTTGHFVFKGEKELGNNLINKLDKALTIHGVVVPKGKLCDEICCLNEASHIAYTEHRYRCDYHR